MNKNAIKHFKLISKHKYYVFKNCIKAGIPIQGITHDLSKYSPTEFLESIKYYQGDKSPIDACKKVNGYSNAWLHHKGKNPHHYEYWQDDFDHGGKPLKMPFKYAIELICDYLAAGQEYMKDNFTYKAEYDWWIERRKKPLSMHPQTKIFIELMLKEMSKTNSNNCLNKKIAKRIYLKADNIAKKRDIGKNIWYK